MQRAFWESLEQKGKDEDERIKAKIKDMFKEVLDELGVATKADLEKLKADSKIKTFYIYLKLFSPFRVYLIFTFLLSLFTY